MSIVCLGLFVVAPAALVPAVRLVPEQYLDVQSAIAACSPGDTVSIGPGSWVGPVDVNVPDVVLLGRNGASLTALDGLDGLRPLTISAPGVVVQDLTIRDGVAQYGGGVSILAGPCTLVGCTVRDCEATPPGPPWLSGGGGVHAGAGVALVLDDCTLLDNEALDASTDGGGGLLFEGTSLLVRGCTIDGNGQGSYDLGTSKGGGGIQALADGVVVEDTAFIDNATDGTDGGGLQVIGDGTVVRRCSFFGNRQIDGGVRGISARLVGDDVEVADCTFTANFNSFPDGPGGNLSIAGDRADVRDLLFSNNMLEFWGAIDLSGEDGLVRNVHVTSNREGCIRVSGSTNLRNVSIDSFHSDYGDPAIQVAGSGGGSAQRIRVSSSSGFTSGMSFSNTSYDVLDCLLAGLETGLVVNVSGTTSVRFFHTAIVDCVPSFVVAGAYAFETVDASLEIHDSILWNPLLSAEFELPQAAPNVFFSDVRGGASGVGNLDVDPGFVPTTGDPATDYRLSSSSPLIDVGNPTNVGLRPDLGGFSRRLDGDLDGIARVDVGPYEYTESFLDDVTPFGGPTRVRVEGPAGGYGAVAIGPAGAALPLGQYGTVLFDIAAPSAAIVVTPLLVPFEANLPGLPAGIGVQALVFDAFAAVGQVTNPLFF